MPATCVEEKRGTGITLGGNGAQLRRHDHTDGAAAPAFWISGERRRSDVIPAIHCCRGIATQREDLCQLLRSAHI